MGGLGSLFKKIIPIIMLVCFICLGITHTFQQVGQNNITYLTQQVYTENGEWKPIENATHEEIENGHTAYKLDINSYMQNINSDSLQTATTNIFSLDAFTRTLNKFNDIWSNGYQFGDGIRTIINSVILVINTFIMIINVGLMPFRIIASLLLTGMSLVGININSQGIIIDELKGFLTYAAIPFINVANNADYIDNRLEDTSYNFANSITVSYDELWLKRYWFKFKTADDAEWAGMAMAQNNLYYIKYRNASSTTEVEAYVNGHWTNQNFKNITITETPNLSPTDVDYLITEFDAWSITNDLSNTTWLIDTAPPRNTIKWINTAFTSNNTNFNAIFIQNYDNEVYIQYVTTGIQQYVYHNGTWDNNYTTITFGELAITQSVANARRQVLNIIGHQIA